MQKYVNVATDLLGNVVPSATVTVYNGGTAVLSTIYSDNASTAKANPFLTGSDGVFYFYAANGRYDVVITKTGYTFAAAATSDVILYDYSTGTVPPSNGFRLVKSGANLTLDPVGGTSIRINGVDYSLTSTMPTCPISENDLEGNPIVALGLYYIYLSTAGVLRASTTAYTRSASTLWIPYRTGDLTNRLVGIARAADPAAWIDTPTQRMVCSYDNRIMVVGERALAAPVTFNSAVAAAISADLAIGFVTFANDPIYASSCGWVTGDAGTPRLDLALWLDTSATPFQSATAETMSTAPHDFAISGAYGASPTTAVHSVNLAGTYTAGGGSANVTVQSAVVSVVLRQ